LRTEGKPPAGETEAFSPGSLAPEVSSPKKTTTVPKVLAAAAREQRIIDVQMMG